MENIICQFYVFTFHGQKRVRDVSRVVDAESDGDDDDDAGHDVDGQTPKVHEPHHVDLKLIFIFKYCKTCLSTICQGLRPPI
jgi:hypothetical protein